MKETHIHILGLNTGDWIASRSCRLYHWEGGGKSLIPIGHNGRHLGSRTEGVYFHIYQGCTRTNVYTLQHLLTGQFDQLRITEAAQLT